MSKFEKYKKNFEAIGETTIAVEEYFDIEANEETMHICLFTYFFHKVSSDNVLKVEIKIFHKLRSDEYLPWLRSEVLYEYEYDTTAGDMDCTDMFKIYQLEELSPQTRHELETELKRKLIQEIEVHLDGLYDYLFKYKTQSALKRGWINRRTQFAVNGLVDSVMFGANVWMANNDTNAENTIKNAATRNNVNRSKAKATLKSEATKTIAAANAAINATEEAKIATDAVVTDNNAKTVAANEAEAVAAGIETTPEIINNILGGMALPKDKLTIQNIELDGAFRISYE